MTPDPWHMTHDVWQETCDKRHVTCDMWWKVNILSKCQVPSSNGLGVKVFWSYFHKLWVTQFMSGEGVFRTAPASPGLLITLKDMHLTVCASVNPEYLCTSRLESCLPCAQFIVCVHMLHISVFIARCTVSPSPLSSCCWRVTCLRRISCMFVCLLICLGIYLFLVFDCLFVNLFVCTYI